MTTYTQLLKECQETVKEIMPWDLDEKLKAGETPYLLDVREPQEFAAMRIENSVNIPRGILETAIEWGFDDTEPTLVTSRDKEVIVICRSGNRSLLADRSMQLMGYKNVISLQTGLRGWNDYELPLSDAAGNTVDEDIADEFLASKVRPDQMPPK